MKDVAKWLLAFICFIAAIGTMTISWVSGIIYLLVGLFLIPPLLKCFETTSKLVIPRPLKYVIVVFGIFLGNVFSYSKNIIESPSPLMDEKVVVAEDAIGKEENKYTFDKDGSLVSSPKGDAITYQIENKEFNQVISKA
jgi:hypothetical protein